LTSILIKNGYLVTLDKNRMIIRDGAVAIENGEIVNVGKTVDVKRKYNGEIEIDATHKIVMPGFIDCHVHLAQALIRGVEDNRRLISWLNERIWPLQGVYDEEIGRTSAQLCCLEMIKSGTTCFAETLIQTRYGFDEIAKVVSEMGMRAALAKTIMEAAGYAAEEQAIAEGMRESREESTREAMVMIEKWHKAGNDRIRVWFGPRPPGACSPDLFREVSELSRKYGTGVNIHLAEVREDVAYLKERFDKTPMEFMNEVGLTGPNIMLIHAVWLTDKDIKLLAQTKTNICHCPSSNMKLASGFARVPEMLEAGVNVALGCDGGVSNDCYDMIREMKIAALIHKARLQSPTAVTAEQAIEIATINGAKALSWDDKIGSLEVGKRADIILIDAKKPHMVPYRNLPSNLVYSAVGSDVDTVIIDGKIVMEKRVIKTIDEVPVIEKALELSEKVDERAGITIRPRWKEF